MNTNKSDSLAKFHADHAIYSFACELTHRYPAETGPYFELYERLQVELDRVLSAALALEKPCKLYVAASRLKSNSLFAYEGLNISLYCIGENEASLGEAIIAEHVWDGLHHMMQARVEVGRSLNVGLALEKLAKGCSRAVVFSVPIGAVREDTFIALKKVNIEKQNVRVNITREFLAPYFHSMASPEVKEFVDRILQSPEEFQEAA